MEKIDAWIKGCAAGRRVLWLHGPAGAGKSAIAQTVAETCARRNGLAASFFFARTAARRNEVKYLFPTIVVQTALSAPEKRQRLDDILNQDPYIAERALGSVDLLASLLNSAQAPQASSPFLVIIDGLDECQRNRDQRWILEQVSRMVNTQHLPLRFIIVSRPESHLMETFKERDLWNLTNLNVLSLYGDYGALNDVSMYLRSEFSRICGAKMHRDVMRFVPRPWSSDSIIERLVSNSGGYFIYASTVTKFIDEEYYSPVARLDHIFGTSNSSSELNPFAELDQLYIQILSSYPIPDLHVLKLILGFAVMSPVLRSRSLFPFFPSIEDILGLAPGQVELTLRGLRSLVSSTAIHDYKYPHLIHASFGDFLLDKARAKDYHIDSEEWIYTTFRYVFTLACKSLDPQNCASQGRFLISSIGIIKEQMCGL